MYEFKTKLCPDNEEVVSFLNAIHYTDIEWIDLAEDGTDLPDEIELEVEFFVEAEDDSAGYDGGIECTKARWKDFEGHWCESVIDDSPEWLLDQAQDHLRWLKEY